MFVLLRCFFRTERVNDRICLCLSHPNIAKVLEADATETGRPYFVMELVKAVPITRYCDENDLYTATRLGLFVQVYGLKSR